MSTPQSTAQPTHAAVRVLLVDDERSFREPLARHLREKDGYHVVEAATAEQALACLRKAQDDFHVVLVDDLLTPKEGESPRTMGLELARQIRALRPETAVILYTGWGWDPQRILDALHAGVYRVLYKPFHVEELRAIIAHLAEHRTLRNRAQEGEILQHLHELSRVLFTTDEPALSFQERVQAALEAIQRLGFDRVRLYRYDEQQRELVALACVGMGEREAAFRGLHIPEDQDPYLQRLQEVRAPVIFNDRDRSEVKTQPPGFVEMGVPDVPEWACVPLYHGGRFWGKIVVDNYDRQTPIDRDLLRPLALFGAQLAALLAYETLLEQSRRRGDLLDALDRAAVQIRAERDPWRLLHEIVRQGVQVIGCQAGALWINRPHLRRVELAAVVGLPDMEPGLESPYGQGLAGTVARQNETVRVPDYSRWAQAHPAFARYAIRAALGVPIRSREGAIELILCLGFTEPGYAFGPLEEEVATRFAQQAGIAWTKAQLLDAGSRHAARIRLLNALHRYIERCEDEIYILHALATCLTADFGLRFNRAVVLRREPGREVLQAVVGIGHLDLETAEAVWEDLQGWTFEHYREAVVNRGLSLEDPVHKAVFRQRVPLPAATDTDPLAQVLYGDRPVVWSASQATQALPDWLAKVLQPKTDVVLVPLRAGSDVLGLVVLDNHFTGSPVTDEVLEATATFADTGATVLANLRAHQEAQRVGRQLETFLTGYDILAEQMDARQAVRRLLEHLQAVLEADRIFMILYDPGYGAYDGEIISPRKGMSLPPLHDVVRPNGLTHEVVAVGALRVVQYPEPGESGHQPHPYFDDIRTALGVPMRYQGNLLGVVWIQYCRRREPSSREKQIAQLLVDQVAVAYRTALRTHQDQIIREALEAIGRAATPEEILQVVVDGARNLVEADSAVLYVYDPAGVCFDYARSLVSGLDPAQWQELQGANPLPDTTAERILEQGWLEVPDVTKSPVVEENTQKTLTRLGICSFAGVALGTPENRLGVLYVNRRHPRRLTEEEQVLLRSLAQHGASALERLRLLNRLRRVHSASRQIAELATHDRLQDTLLKAVAEHVKDILAADAVTLYLYDEEKKRLSPRPITVGVRYPERMREETIIGPDSIVYKMMAEPEPYWVEDVDRDPHFAGRRFARDEGSRSLVAVPLRVYEHPVGVLFVNYRSPHRFSPEEQEDLNLLAHQAAVAIRAAQMRDRLQERAQMLRQLAEAARSISASMDAQEILDAAVRTAAKITGTYGPRAVLTVIALEDPDWPGTLVFRAAEPPERLPGLQQGTGRLLDPDTPRRGIVGRAFLEGRSQLVDDVSEDPDYISVDDTIRSELAVPIKLGEQVLGVLDVESDEPAAFDREDQEALELLAAEIAVALENARRYRELQEAKGLLGQRTLLAWMGLADNLWRHTNAKQALVIQETANLIGEELENHRRQCVARDSLDRIQSRLQRIANAARSIQNRPTLPPPNPEDVERVELVSLVRERVTQLQRNPAYRVVCFHRPSFQAVYTQAHPEWLRRALDILVDNAVDAAACRADPQVEVRLVTGTTWVEIQVQDNGPGIPSELQEKIGQRFVDKADDAKGLGMGLAVAQIILETYGGELRIVETGEQGTTMALRLPVFSG